jgi:hypothetical protein
MARILTCRYCRVELETLKLGGARAMVMCFACEQIGFADEVAHGAPLWPAEIGETRKAPAPHKIKSGAGAKWRAIVKEARAVNRKLRPVAPAARRVRAG